MIVDCFTFYNELEMLYYRLSLLNDYVDHFVLVESNQTFAGNTMCILFGTQREPLSYSKSYRQGVKHHYKHTKGDTNGR